MRRALLLALAASLTFATPAVAGHGTAGERALDITHLGNAPKEEATNSDLAFWGDLVYAGNYNGFRIIDVSQPAAPRVLTDFQCRGAQSDVSVWDTGSRRLLFLSVDARQTKPECSAPDPTRTVGWEGVRIFDVTDPRSPRFVKGVATDCGSHTNTVVPDPENRRVLVYANSYPLTEQGVTQGDDAQSESQCSPAHQKLSVIDVPYEAPETARVVSTPSTAPADGCHDVGVFLELKVAAAACLSEGQLWDISDPVNPRITDHLYNPAINFWHSGSFSWDGRTAIFGDEEGGAAVTHGCTPAGSPPGATWFYDRRNPSSPPGRFSQQRMQLTEGDLICTTHNYNPIPVLDRNLFASAFYEAGTGIVDFTDPARAREIAFFDAQGTDGNPAGDAWSSYFYNDLIVANDIERGVDTFRYTGSAIRAARRFGHLNPQVQERVLAQQSATLACPSRTPSRRARVRGSRRTTVVATLTQQGQPVRGATVRARGLGFSRRARTNARGQVLFRVRARRAGRVAVSSPLCGGRLSVRARTAQSPRFTG